MTAAATSAPCCPACASDDVEQWPGRHGDSMATCRTCGSVGVVSRAVPAMQPLEPAEPEPIRRRWLGCCRCGGDMWPTSGRPRIPVCDQCKTRSSARRADDSTTEGN
jgi:hypothetical protein